MKYPLKIGSAGLTLILVFCVLAYASLPQTVSAASLVQSQVTYASTITFPKPVHQGDVLVAAVSCNGGTSVPVSVTDNKNNTWTMVANLNGIVSGNINNAVSGSVSVAVANGNNTPTITISACAGGDQGGSVYEYSGVSAVPEATSTSIISVATTNPTCASVGISHTDVVLCFTAEEDAATTWGAATGGFTFEGGNATHIDGYADLLTALPGTYAGGLSSSVSEGFIALQVALPLTGRAGVTLQNASLYVKNSGVYVD